MNSIKLPIDLNERIESAIQYFWNTRSGQITKQTAHGVRDQGNRGAVTGGKQLDGFVDLIWWHYLFLGGKYFTEVVF